MKINVGVDIENINRFNNLSLKKSSTFLKKIYASKEIDYCLAKKYPSKHFAARFAAKEAVYKALQGMNNNNEKILYNEIEVIRKTSGAPEVKIKKKDFRNLKISISLSHSKNNAIAFAIIYE